MAKCASLHTPDFGMGPRPHTAYPLNDPHATLLYDALSLVNIYLGIESELSS